MLHLKIKDFDLTAIAESGQCFRMTAVGKLGENYPVYRIIASGRCLLMSGDPEGDRDSFLAGCTEMEWTSFYRHYFDLDTDYQIYRDYADKEDRFLRQCMEYGKGIRILNQDPWEMLISFIISQRKSVPAIRTTVERLCTLAGDKKSYDSSEWHKLDPEIPEIIIYHSFPDAGAIARLTPEEVNSTGTGYRTSYIMEAARGVLTGEVPFRELALLSDSELTEYLLKLHGVGIKVASCAALFGFHRLSVCPEDVWMKRVKEQFYGGKWPESYEPVLGVLQQYMFYYARLEHKKDRIKDVR